MSIKYGVEPLVQNSTPLESDSGLAVVNDATHHLLDFDGNAALNRAPEDLKQEVQTYAIASLPEIMRKMVFIVMNSKSNKDIIEAAKFVKSIADGEIKAKSINEMAKKWSDEELGEVLNGK